MKVEWLLDDGGDGPFIGVEQYRKKKAKAMSQVVFGFLVVGLGVVLVFLGLAMVMYAQWKAGMY